MLAGWVVVLVAATALLPDISGADETPLAGLVASDSRAAETELRSAQIFGVPLLSRVAVVQRDPDGLSREEQARVFDRALRINERRDPLLASVVFAVPVLNTGRVFPSSRESGTTAVTYLYFLPDRSLNARDALGHTYASRAAEAGDGLVGVTGAVPARLEQWRAISAALPRVELASVLLVLVVVGLSLRSLGAPLLVLAAAAIAYFVAVRVVAWFGTVADVTVPRDVQPVLIVLILGITTDYAVFFLVDARRRLARGELRTAAALATARSFVPIVAVAGLIVALGTAALLMGELEFFRALGPAAAMAVLIALAVSLTLVPAALAAFGRALFWPGLRSGRPDGDVRRWRQALTRALVRPRSALALTLVTLALLLAAAAGMLTLRLGVTVVRGLPEDSETRRAAAAAGQGFAPGILSPTEVLLTGAEFDGRLAALRELHARLARLPGVAGVVGPTQLPEGVGRSAFVAADGTAARYIVILEAPPLSARAIERLRALERALPRVLAESGLGGARAALAGDTALARETVDNAIGDTGRVGVAAVLVNLALLALFLRAVVAPLYLVATSVVALAATLGIAALVFGSVGGASDTTYYVPFAAAVLLLSLGSDYNVFVVGRIWEQIRRRPLTEAVAYAAPRASTAITIAGIALALSFALLALVPLAPFREFAFVMTVGVLLEAFVVRPVLVPALIVLFGRWSWWPAGGPSTVGHGALDEAEAA